MTRFGSVCSGIEAASVAWHPIGWRAAWLAEIEPFPSAVLAHHYPDVPNLGDMTKLAAMIKAGQIEAPDVFCGGTPCQAFSVAGLRRSLDDARGNLSLTFCEIADAIDANRLVHGREPCVVFWENVPGVLNTKDNAFGCFLAGLAGEADALQPPGGKWQNAGAVFGPTRAVAWRVLNAQYFGVAQRRRRVFVVASARNGFDPAAVLFELDGVRRDTAPSREAGKATSAGAALSVALRGREGGATAELGDDKAGCLRASSGGGDKPHALVPAVAACLTTGTGQRYDTDTDTDTILPVAHTLRGEGFDASEDGTGRGTPLVPVAFDTTQITSKANRSNPQPGDPCHPLAAGAHAPAIAFPANLSGTQHASAEDLAPAMGALNPTAVAYAIQAGAIKTNPLIGPDGVGIRSDDCAYTIEARSEVQAVAFQSSQSGVRIGDTHATLDANNGPRRHNGALVGMQVRRLTPRECERLQGFPDDYTAIPWRKKPASECPDGPRYKALGNSWAVPNVRWIGQRIDQALRAESASNDNQPAALAAIAS
jgi:DNA (cytosine-5)-methyltransferase 1